MAAIGLQHTQREVIVPELTVDQFDAREVSSAILVVEVENEGGVEEERVVLVHVSDEGVDKGEVATGGPQVEQSIQEGVASHQGGRQRRGQTLNVHIL